MQKIIKIMALAFLVTGAYADENKSDKAIQDTAKAVEFFKNELAFKTNAHGAKMVVEGKVKNVTIVDVRDEKSFAEGHIPGAVNVPYDKHDGFAGNETEFSELRKDGHNYVYCYTETCNLSQKAAMKFASLGYPVKEMVGGFQSWKEGKYKIEKGSKSVAKK